MKLRLICAIGCIGFTSVASSHETVIQLSPNRWHQITLPTNGYVENVIPLIEQLANDDIVNPKLWAYDGTGYKSINTPTNSQSEELANGLGFWFKHSGEGYITLTSTSPTDQQIEYNTPCTPDVDCLRTSLGTAGWSMLGNPFDTDKSIDADVVFSSSEDCPEGCSYAEAIGFGMIGMKFWNWGGNEYADFADTDIHPADAFWVRALKDGVSWNWSNPYCVEVE